MYSAKVDRVHVKVEIEYIAKVDRVHVKVEIEHIAKVDIEYFAKFDME